MSCSNFFVDTPENSKERRYSSPNSTTNIDVKSLRDKKVSFPIANVSSIFQLTPSYQELIDEDQLQNGKAMSMPHGPSTITDSSDKVLSDFRKQIFPDKVDWTVQAANGTHVWADTEHTGCFVSQDCKKSGPRKRCSSCRVIAHQKCIEQLEIINQIKCRVTFREAPSKGIIINPTHHIVRRRKQDGRCDECGKNFQSMLSYKSQKDFVAVTCSWCKKAFHVKECSKKFLLEKSCDLGIHHKVILPPTWIVKLPPRKYSQIGGKRGYQTTRRHSSKERRAFVIKSIESENKIPLIVFVNPKSGGNQGARILEKYQYLLNPRQVFDLSNGGPRFALELFRKVQNLRVLVCGGDGTVGWILSDIDRLKINPPPAVAILPLGTGNDLARFLGWGAGYTDEPLGKILSHVEEGEVQKLDRWDIDVSANPDPPKDETPDEVSVSKLPLSIMNNYYSMGADADVCLEFHESREANPERFKSRLKNLYFYGKKGSETIIKRKSKDLYKCIDSLMCDGCDLTEKIKELKPVCLIFLNISSYSAGTSPWGNPSSEDFLPQSCDDGYLEIIGLSSKSMVVTQVGGHGIRIYQCQSAILTTNTKISMQVDGEPCRLNPSKIRIKRRNQAFMIAKKKPRSHIYLNSSDIPKEVIPKVVHIKLYYLTFPQYDTLIKYDIDEIKNNVMEICSLQVDPSWQLDRMRKNIEAKKLSGDIFKLRLTNEWCFLDATWTVRIYRIDEAQETLLHVHDVMEGGGIFVLDLIKKQELSCTLSSVFVKSQLVTPISNLDSSNFGSQKNILSNLVSHSLSLYHSNNSIDNLSTSSSMGDENFSDYSEFSEETSSLPSSPRAPSPELAEQLEEDSSFEVPQNEQERFKALLEAATNGNISRFRIIHEAGTSLSCCDIGGRTPLHLASKYGGKEIVEYISSNVENKYIFDLVENESGQTALHIAAENRRRTICRILVSHGASVSRKDTEGNTPYLLASKSSDLELAKYLQNQERLQLIAADDHETAV